MAQLTLDDRRNALAERSAKLSHEDQIEVVRMALRKSARAGKKTNSDRDLIEYLEEAFDEFEQG